MDAGPEHERTDALTDCALACLVLLDGPYQYRDDQSPARGIASLLKAHLAKETDPAAVAALDAIDAYERHWTDGANVANAFSRNEKAIHAARWLRRKVALELLRRTRSRLEAIGINTARPA